MRMDKFSYAGAEGCLYEAMRWKNKKGKVEPEREGKALIDPEKTHLNETYVHPCLMPNYEFNGLSKEERDAKRGVAIAAYHNSQTGSQARAVMEGEKKSQAIGVVATLPRENPWVQRLELTEEEYTYLCDKMIEPPHDDGVPRKRNAEMEKTIKEKLGTVKMTPAERKECSRFLKGVIKAWLKECGIRQKDVLFWAIHFDESFPHIHCVALPTQEKVYEEDVYSKRLKKDGTRTLLHAKGSKAISYSITPFYAGKTIDDKGDEHYPFFESYHPHIIEKLSTDEKLEGEELEEYLKESIFQETPEEEFALRAGVVNRYGLSEEAKQVAPKLITGKTVGKGYRPADFDREMRDQLVMLSEANRRLEERQAKMQEEFETTYASMRSQLQAVKDEKTAAQAEALAAKSQAAKATLEVAKAKEELEQAKDLLEEKQIELDEKIEQVASLRELIKDLKAELASLVKEVALFVPKVVRTFLTKWKEAKTISQMEKVDTSAQAEALAGAKALTENLRVFGSRAEALLAEEEVVSGVKMATFERSDQKIGFAKKQIMKAAEATGQAEAFEDERTMTLALQDWFNKGKYAPILERKSEVDASLYMKAPVRAERAVEYALERVSELEEVELG